MSSNFAVGVFWGALAVLVFGGAVAIGMDIGVQKCLEQTATRCQGRIIQP